MRAGFAATLERAKAAGAFPPAADALRVARRFQADVSAFRLELHLGSGADDIAALADDMAREIEVLRIVPAAAEPTPEETRTAR